MADLQDLARQLKMRTEALKDLDNRARSLVDGLGELDEGLAQLEDRRRAAQARLQQLQSELHQQERQLGLDEDQLRALRARLQERLRAAAVDGSAGATKALLGAESFTELALRRRFLRVLADNDARLVADVHRAERGVLDERAQLKETAAALADTLRLLEDQTTLVQATRDERAAALIRVRSERELLRRTAEELFEKHRELSSIVAKLAAEPRFRPATGRRGILRGHLMPPVQGGVLIRRFGSTVDPTTRAEIVSNGVDLRAEEGAAVVAIADGRIAHAGWLRGFGRIVIVDHGEGHHTLSAHLSRIQVATGDEVRAGEVIGFVGDTESENGPKLYFELREAGRPRDPAPFLLRN